MTKIILFDIDYTLINTSQLKENLIDVLTNIIQVKKNDFIKAMSLYTKNLKSSTDFRPEGYCLFLSKRFRCNHGKLLDAFYKSNKTYENILYPDTIKLLERLKEKYILGIFSEGYINFQLTKLKASGILPYFDKKYIFIGRRKLSKKCLDLIPANSIIIDDNKKVVDILTKNNIKSLWVNRRDSIKQNSILSVINQSSL